MGRGELSAEARDGLPAVVGVDDHLALGEVAAGRGSGDGAALRHEEPGDALADAPIGTGDEDGVDGLDPSVEGGVDVVDGAGEEETTHRGQADVARAGGG